MRSIKNRLVLLFFAITAAAIGFVYLYVVPQLESSLTAQKLRRLERVAASEDRVLEEALARSAPQRSLRGLVSRVAGQEDVRLTLLAVREDRAGGQPSFVLADSENEAAALRFGQRAAVIALREGRTASAVDSGPSGRVGQTAVPLELRGQPRWVAVFSTPLGDVGDNVSLIRRQIIIAGLIALAAALLAGYWAARAIARRIRRLEAAAEKVAEGKFEMPIPVDSSDELGQLARTFNEMQARLARLDSARREFIANASHELRTPIFSLGGFIELLGDEELDPGTRREFVETMREQVERLTKLTADLLDLSKLDSDAIELRSERVDLSSIARMVADEFGAAARDGSEIGLDLPGTRPVEAVADPDRVAQIVRILLDNALSHTPPGTPVRLITARAGGRPSLTVADRGPGIGAGVGERVFERFYTGNSASGSGLGLAIARELAVRMDGELTLESGGGGASFTLSLPPVPADAESQGVRAGAVA